MDEVERILFMCREVHVYKIPPRPDARGHRCQEWEGNWIFTGRLRVVAKGSECKICLEDAGTGELFAMCPIKTDGPQGVEPVVDSSRYFVLRVEDGNGNHAFIGMGFQERSEAFDFNCALMDHAKHAKEPAEEEEAKELKPAEPLIDLALDKSESIKVNIKGSKFGAGSKSGGGAAAGGAPMALAPPPAAGKLAPPPAAGAAHGRQVAGAAAKKDDDFGDFGDFGGFQGGSAGGAAAPDANDASWVAFD